MSKVAIIGAGAAGCFCAACLRSTAPALSVTLFEAGSRPMAKLAITGGGRCNLTNSFEGIRSLQEAYPRGERLMKRALLQFSKEDTLHWFQERGVPCVLQPDHCYFPRSQDALDVVRCLEKALKGAEIRLNTPVNSVRSFGQRPQDDNCHSERSEESLSVNGELFDYVVVASGGSRQGLPFLDGLGLEIVPPVPSLFTFTVPDESLRSLMGLVVEAGISLQGTAFKASGPLLITDWGFSGPAALKLSSYAARELAKTGYKGHLSVNWLNVPESEARALLQQLAAQNGKKLLSSAHPLPQRLWRHLLGKAGLREEQRWAEVGSKGLNRLCALLINDVYPMAGKSWFREEFVTAGGVALGEINLNTLECRKHPGLYFAGEALDVDAITGGFNLQAAWSTGYLCARSITAAWKDGQGRPQTKN